MDKVKFLMEKNSQILAELENIKKLTKSVNEVRSEITQINEDIEGVVGDISNNSSLLNELEEDIEEHATSIANLSQSLSTISNDIDSIETSVSNLSSSLSDLADTVGDCETNISTLQTEISTVNGQIDDLVSEIDDINDSLESASSNQYFCENLLINSNFLVNQRGASSYSHSNAGINKYTVDRLIHCMGTSFSLVPQAQGGITIQNSSSYSYAKFGQYVEKADNLLAGKTVTLSISVAGVVYSLENVSLEVGDSEEKQMNGGYFGIEYDSAGKYLCFFRVLPSTTITIDWWKLETGNTFTGYSPKTYVEELCMCQRYYLKMDYHWFYIYCLDVNTVWFNISVPSMRVSPQLKLLAKPNWLRGENSYNDVGGIAIKGTWALDQGDVNNVGVEASISGASLSGNIFLADYINLEFDAEIY